MRAESDNRAGSRRQLDVVGEQPQPLQPGGLRVGYRATTTRSGAKPGRSGAAVSTCARMRDVGRQEPMKRAGPAVFDNDRRIVQQCSFCGTQPHSAEAKRRRSRAAGPRPYELGRSTRRTCGLLICERVGIPPLHLRALRENATLRGHACVSPWPELAKSPLRIRGRNPAAPARVVRPVCFARCAQFGGDRKAVEPSVPGSTAGECSAAAPDPPQRRAGYGGQRQ